MAENNVINEKDNMDGEIELDCVQVSKLFKKIKNRGILNENIRYYNGDYVAPSKELLKSKDFIDIIKYYRILKRKSKREMAIKSGIDDETYREYEIKKNQIQDWKIADSFIKILEIEDKVELPDYFKIMKKYSLEQIKDIIQKEGKNVFVKETGIARSTVNQWHQKNAPKTLSTYTYKKMENFFREHKIPY